MINLDWQKEALCSEDNYSNELFFPEQGKAAGQKARAKRVCAACPVKEECLTYALTVPTLDVHNGDAHWVQGIWGATTKLERKQIRAVRGIKKAGVSDD